MFLRLVPTATPFTFHHGFPWGAAVCADGLRGGECQALTEPLRHVGSEPAFGALREQNCPGKRQIKGQSGSSPMEIRASRWESAERMATSEAVPHL